MAGALSVARPNLQTRKIPTCQCPPRLLRPTHPFFEFIPRWLVFSTIEFVEFCKHQLEIRVRIVAVDKTLENVVPKLNGISGYKKQFNELFGTDVTPDGIAKAIASGRTPKKTVP